MWYMICTSCTFISSLFQYWYGQTWLVLHLFRPALTHIMWLLQEGGVSILTAALESCLEVQWNDQYECVLSPAVPPISLEASQRIIEILKILFNVTHSTHRQEPSEVSGTESVFRYNLSIYTWADEIKTSPPLTSTVFQYFTHYHRQMSFNVAICMFSPPSGWRSSLQTPGGAAASLPDEEVFASGRHWWTAGVSMNCNEAGLKWYGNETHH